MQIQVPLDNLQKTRLYLAEKILNLVQMYYTEERIVQITDEEDPYKIREPVAVNQMTPEGIVVNDLTVGEYDVIIGTAPARDNFDEMQFAEAISLRQVGVPIPDDMIVEYSHLSRKADIAKRIRIMQGMEPPSDEQVQVQQFKMQAEMQKIQLEIAKMEAEVKNLESTTQLNAAKAQGENINPRLKAAELESKLTQKREELSLRERLSDMTNQMRKQQSDTQAATKIAAAAMKPTGGNSNGQN